jgi:hypothetical protein
MRPTTPRRRRRAGGSSSATPPPTRPPACRVRCRPPRPPHAMPSPFARARRAHVCPSSPTLPLPPRPRRRHRNPARARRAVHASGRASAMAVAPCVRVPPPPPNPAPLAACAAHGARRDNRGAVLTRGCGVRGAQLCSIKRLTLARKATVKLERTAPAAAGAHIPRARPHVRRLRRTRPAPAQAPRPPTTRWRAPARPALSRRSPVRTIRQGTARQARARIPPCSARSRASALPRQRVRGRAVKSGPRCGLSPAAGPSDAAARWAYGGRGGAVAHTS